jgi:hypothetical protein
MRNPSKAEDSASEGSCRRASRKPNLQIVAARVSAPKPSIAEKELFNYIEDLSLELGALSADSNQDMLAFLFKCAALEARRQGRYHRRAR